MILSSPAVRKIADADVDEVTQLFVHSLDLSIPGVTFSTDPQYAALDLVAASLRKRLFPPRSREAYVLEDPATGALLGYGNVKPEGGPAGDADELDMFFVKASEGGKGYGGLLMKAVQAEFAGGLWVTVFKKNERAIGFYRKWGFEMVERHEHALNLSMEDASKEETACMMKWPGRSSA